MMQSAALVVFILALLVTGVLGTETGLLFFWPGAALLGVAGLLATLKWRLRVLFPPSDVCLATVLLFASYTLGRALMSPVAAYAREDVVILLGCLVTYVLTVTAASHPRWRIALVGCLLVLVLGNLAVGSVHLSGNWSFHILPTFLRGSEAGRIGGFYVNPNHLAAFLSFALFLSLGWLCFGRGGAALKLLLGFLIVAMAVGMSLTVSRGALIGLAAGGLVYAVLALWIVWQTQRHFFWSLLGGAVVLSVLGGAVLWKVNDEYLRQRIENNSMTDDIRFGIWDTALGQFQQAPLLGEGARMFYDGGIKYRSAMISSWSPEPMFAHSEPLQLLSDYGIVGATLLLIMVLAHGLNALRFLRWFVREKFILTGRVLSMNLALCLGALSALVATLVHSVFEFHYHVPATAMGGALILGLLANPGFETMQRPLMRVLGVRIATKLALGCSACALLAGFWIIGRGDYALVQARLAEARKDPQAYAMHLDEAAQLDASNGEVFYLRGLMKLDAPSTPDEKQSKVTITEAIEDLQKATALNPYNYLYHLALADGLDAVGRYDEALKSIENALVAAPYHEESRLALGVHWHRLSRWKEAEKAYLWASTARAMNKQGVANWYTSYQLMLKHAALSRGQKP
ncbi:MAG: O-antigen ligase family protein [Verrucomicrobia bacterium]|nr:O-antigen ligase family protein [Verrucomicrobiota bacterium]